MTNDQKVAAIQAAAQIVTTLVSVSSSFKNLGDSAKEAKLAANAYREVFAAIKEGADGVKP